MSIRMITSGAVSDAMLNAFNAGLAEVGQGGKALIRANDVREEKGAYDDKENTGGGASALYKEFHSADNDNTVDLIISVGGVVAAHAAQDQIRKTPFLVIIGQLPKTFSLSTDKNPSQDKFCGGMNLDMVGQNILRHDLLVAQYALATDQVCLVWNSNSKTGKYEKKEWVRRGWKEEEVKSNAPSDIQQAFSNAKIRGCSAAVVSGDSYFTSQMDTLVPAANGTTMKICYPFTVYLKASTPPASQQSMFFGPDIELAYRLTGRKAGAVLQVGKGDLPDTGLDTCPTIGPVFI
jgi:hypothetical protein